MNYILIPTDPVLNSIKCIIFIKNYLYILIEKEDL